MFSFISVLLNQINIDSASNMNIVDILFVLIKYITILKVFKSKFLLNCFLSFSTAYLCIKKLTDKYNYKLTACIAYGTCTTNCSFMLSINIFFFIFQQIISCETTWKRKTS